MHAFYSIGLTFSMRSIRPVPPKERKPIPSWSLLRRHSLIIPRNRLPLNRTERIPVNVPCHLSTVEGTQQLVESTQPELRANPLILGCSDRFRPKLLQFPTETCLKAEYHEKYECNTSLHLLKLKTDSHKLGPELIRVPVNLTFSSEAISHLKSKLQSVVPLESLPMLWLPNITDHVHHLSHPTKVELLSVKQLASLHPKPHSVDTMRKTMFTEPIPLISASAPAPQFFMPTKLLTLSQDFYPNQQASLVSGPRLIPLDSNFTTYCKTHEIRGTGHESSRRSFPLLKTSATFPKIPVSPIDEAAMSDMQKKAKMAYNESEHESSSHTNLSVTDAYPEDETNDVRPVHFTQKCVATARSQNIGTQFDFIDDSLDAFIFNEYVVDKDGVRFASVAEKQSLPEPLANRDIYLPISDDTVLPPVFLGNFLNPSLTDDKQPFLSIQDESLNEWTTFVPQLSNFVSYPSEVKAAVPVFDPSDLDKLEIDALVTGSNLEPSKDQSTDTKLVHTATSPLPPEVTNQTELSIPPVAMTVDSVTSKMLATHMPSDNAKQTDDLGDVWLGSDATRVRLDVVKALTELDERLCAVDKVSTRLEEKYKRSQEILQTILRLNQQNQVDVSPLANEPHHPRLVPKICIHEPDISIHNTNLNVNNREKDGLEPKPAINALSVANDVVRNRPSSARRLPSKPVRKDMLVRSEVEQSVMHHSISPLDLTSQNRPRASSASLYRKRDLARSQRRSTFSARRCDETIKFVDKVLSECVVTGTPAAPSVGNKPPKHNSRCDQRASRGTAIRTSKNVSGRKTLPATQKISIGLAKSSDSRRPGQGLHAQQLCRGHASHIVGRKQSLPMGSLTLALQSDEEDQQTTILSDWSVGSNVKRILGRNDELICPISSCPSPVFSGSETATKSTIKVVFIVKSACVSHISDRLMWCIQEECLCMSRFSYNDPIMNITEGYSETKTSCTSHKMRNIQLSDKAQFTTKACVYTLP
ncbi:hypothetical protein EG68_02387 [Paragonimus skrjabini miyazakii]|uniref:Uncharacterized protein n=1 Tax=Paragonimus skrjabini miyazakii TaxID=59628 RepID=A0A8S9Z4U9_9TREM|nr:hypothetical protein EG68_02387 [Paragonimus skrjabini miyazakii]